MNSSFEILSRTIQSRRTIKADRMNGQTISDEEIERIVQLADFAPTHGRTEPWRLFVFSEKALQRFCEDHGEMYKKYHQNFQEHKYDKMRMLYETVSHLIIVIMKRTEGSKIPAQEEYAACCAAAQNMLLGATALDVSSIWSTGGMVYSSQMNEYLNLDKNDQVVGFLYLGYSDEKKKDASRKIALSEKIIMKS